jgi:hypothetical protein
MRKSYTGISCSRQSFASTLPVAQERSQESADRRRSYPARCGLSDEPNLAVFRAYHPAERRREVCPHSGRSEASSTKFRSPLLEPANSSTADRDLCSRHLATRKSDVVLHRRIGRAAAYRNCIAQNRPPCIPESRSGEASPTARSQSAPITRLYSYRLSVKLHMRLGPPRQRPGDAVEGDLQGTV